MDNLLYLLIGAYTAGLSEGIYLYRFDSASGDAQYVHMVEMENPSYIDTGNGIHFYAVTENSDTPSYAHTLYFNREEEKLLRINSMETFASSPCYIATDTHRTHAVTANYGGGSISVFGIQGDTLLPSKQLIILEGSGADTLRQAAPHLHCVKFSPDGKYLFAADLGTDRIYRYEVNREGGDTAAFLNEKTMKPYPLPGGSGPRHLAFHPSNKYMYVVNELSGTVTGFQYREGELTEIQTVRADTLGGRASADVGITPNGRFLYASNRNKGDGIAIFSINEANGQLTQVGYQPTGRHPRNLAITPNGKYLLAACLHSSLIEVFEIDGETGLLKNVNKNITDIDTPVVLKFL
ncbi:MAG: lactonase family protein [Tannerellaceae bacterium]|jgi:6-phosphogluconolactonase (cycloisomerase 2 family)|nr:lactonase family protein [Tannerellaceae bacterium]